MPTETDAHEFENKSLYFFLSHVGLQQFQAPPRCSLSFSIYESIYAPVMMCKQKRCAANIGITPRAPLWLWAAREICIERDAMSLWVDKYRPTTLSKLDYHKEQAGRLKKLVSTGQEARWSGSSSLLSFFSFRSRAATFRTCSSTDRPGQARKLALCVYCASFTAVVREN